MISDAEGWTCRVQIWLNGVAYWTLLGEVVHYLCFIVVHVASDIRHMAWNIITRCYAIANVGHVIPQIAPLRYIMWDDAAGGVDLFGCENRMAVVSQLGLEHRNQTSALAWT